MGVIYHHRYCKYIFYFSTPREIKCTCWFEHCRYLGGENNCRIFDQPWAVYNYGSSGRVQNKYWTVWSGPEECFGIKMDYWEGCRKSCLSSLNINREIVFFIHLKHFQFLREMSSVSANNKYCPSWYQTVWSHYRKSMENSKHKKTQQGTINIEMLRRYKVRNDKYISVTVVLCLSVSRVSTLCPQGA